MDHRRIVGNNLLNVWSLSLSLQSCIHRQGDYKMYGLHPRHHKKNNMSRTRVSTSHRRCCSILIWSEDLKILIIWLNKFVLFCFISQASLALCWHNSTVNLLLSKLFIIYIRWFPFKNTSLSELSEVKLDNIIMSTWLLNSLRIVAQRQQSRGANCCTS